MNTDTHLATPHGPVARPRTWFVADGQGRALTEVMTLPQASREWDRLAAEGQAPRLRSTQA